MTYFLQLLITGVMLGTIYALLAVGFVVIFKTSKILNVAQGELLMFGAYLSWFLSTEIGLPIWLTFMITLVVAAVLGILINYGVMRHMIGASAEAGVMMTIALSYLLSGATIGIFSKYSQVAFKPWLPDNPLRFWGVVLSLQNVYIFIISLVAIGFLFFFFQRTKTGLVMRASSEDQQVVQSLGGHVTRVITYAWIIACMSASVSGIFMGTLGGLTFGIREYGLMVIPVIILGGFESIEGAIIGGVIIGAIECVGTGYLDTLIAPGFGSVLPFILIIFILAIRPSGLFGLVKIERV